MTCLNCQQEATGKFCPNCGQRTEVKRITIREGWNDFWARIYGVDGKLMHTLRDLTIRPGVVAKKYIEGNRVLYYGPVGYFFLMLTIYVLFISIFDIDMLQLFKISNEAIYEEGSGQEQNALKIQEWIFKHQRLVSFLYIPFYALGAVLLFRKNKYNFAEHSTLVFYTQGHYLWPTIIILIILKFTGYSHIFAKGMFVSLLIGALYYAYGCRQLYTAYKPGRAMFRGVLVHIFSFFTLMFTVMVLMIIAVIIVVIIDSELLKPLLEPPPNVE
ncbi:MAG: DUF3667 domain-containing protein [Cyclobacteriaceae bacterium]|nr:DUF3667 domain-containing protein [Cyclobacteriaceae bacterium]